MHARCRTAFTLMELLVVIAIIALLMSIITPSLKEARERGKRAVCLANLRAMGQSLYVYANDNDDALVPGDSRVSWEAWGLVAEPGGCASPTGVGGYRQVNLGHLMASEDIIPLPHSKEHTIFCPSSKSPDGGKISDQFEQQWGKPNGHAVTSYMFNNALDGFDNFVQDGTVPVMSHEDAVQYLLVDASAHVFKNRPLVYDDSVGPERLQDVSARHGVCFPNILLGEWLAENRVNMDEARAFLNDPTGWAGSHQTGLGGGIALANIKNSAIVHDVVGVWGGSSGNPPSG